MTDPVSTIRNLGPRSEEAFARAGLHSADQVRAIGADAAYARLLATGTRPHFIGYGSCLAEHSREWHKALFCNEKQVLEKFQTF